MRKGSQFKSYRSATMSDTDIKIQPDWHPENFEKVKEV